MIKSGEHTDVDPRSSGGGGGDADVHDRVDPNPDVWCSSYVVPEFNSNNPRAGDDFFTRARCIAAALDPCMMGTGGSTVAVDPDGVRSSQLSEQRKRKLLFKYYPQEVANFILHSAISHNELLEALQRVPYLVTEETPLVRYVLLLQRHDGSNRKTQAAAAAAAAADGGSIELLQREAATRIILHWKVRKYFFGERAFLPMIMTHAAPSNGAMVEGALSQEDVEWLKLGVAAILPPGADTVHGGSVGVSDRSRLPDHYVPARPSVPSSTRHDNICLRFGFYMLHLLHTTTAAASEGGSGGGLLVVAVAQERHPPSPYHFNWNLIFCENVFPITALETHIMLLPSKQRRRDAFETRKRRADDPSTSFLSYAVHKAKRLLEETRRYAVGGLQFSFGYTDQQVAQKLCLTKGLDINCFPTWMGGRWDEHTFDRWIDQQKEREREMFAKYAAIKHRFTPTTKRGPKPEAVRSKERREHAKVREQQMKQQVQQLRLQNEQLNRENVRLQQLLECAQVEISVLDGTDLDAELLELELGLIDDDESALKVDDELALLVDDDDLPLVDEHYYDDVVLFQDT